MTPCDRCRDAIDRRFVGRTDALVGKDQVHLADCPECRAYFSRLFETDGALARALGTDADEVLGPGEVEMLCEAVLSSPIAVEPQGRRSAWPWVTGTAALFTGAAALLLLFVYPSNPPGADNELRARGPGTAPAEALSLRVFCLSESGAVLRTLVPTVPGVAADSCPQQGRLAFSYRNRDDVLRYLRIVVVDADHRVQSAWPEGDGERVVPVADDTPLAASVPLGELGGQQVEVVGVFSKQPLEPPALSADLGERELARWIDQDSIVSVVRQRVLVVGGGS